jgi:hypothetical protein
MEVLPAAGGILKWKLYQGSKPACVFHKAGAKNNNIMMDGFGRDGHFGKY